MTDIILGRGIKYTCGSCAVRFYDLNKHPATCPKCGLKVPPAVEKMPRRTRRRTFEDNSTQDKNAFTPQVTEVSVSTPKPKPTRWKN